MMTTYFDHDYDNF